MCCGARHTAQNIMHTLRESFLRVKYTRFMFVIHCSRFAQEKRGDVLRVLHFNFLFVILRCPSDGFPRRARDKLWLVIISFITRTSP
jgi:hypothetical protein